MGKLWLNFVILANAMVLVLPPSWCCTVRFASKPAEDKPQCCAAKEARPCDRDRDPSEPRPAVDCCCHIDTTLPPNPEVVARDLANGPIVTVTSSGESAVCLGHEPLVEIAKSPPLQILHCIWLC